MWDKQDQRPNGATVASAYFFIGLDHPIGEGTWAPALPQQLVNRISGLGKFPHG